MSLSIKVNRVRRQIMRALTKNIGTSRSAGKLDRDQVKRILISRPNKRLGNLLMLTPLLQEIETTFPNASVDLFVRGGLANVLFEKYPNVSRIIGLPGKPFKQLPEYLGVWFTLRKHRYNLVINLQESSSSGRLSTTLAKSKNKSFGESDIVDGVQQQFAKAPVMNLRKYLTEIGTPAETSEIPFLDLRLTSDEKENGKKVLSQIFPDGRPVITIFTFATGAKMLSKEWWAGFYNGLQTRFPNHNILEVLPAENVSQIDFACPTYYSRDIREIGAVMAATEIFIGADSGIMHLASSVRVPVLGLFGVTWIEKYEAYNPGSRAVDTKIVSVEQCLDLTGEMLASGIR